MITFPGFFWAYALPTDSIQAFWLAELVSAFPLARRSQFLSFAEPQPSCQPCWCGWGRPTSLQPTTARTSCRTLGTNTSLSTSEVVLRQSHRTSWSLAWASHPFLQPLFPDVAVPLGTSSSWVTNRWEGGGGHAVRHVYELYYEQDVKTCKIQSYLSCCMVIQPQCNVLSMWHSVPCTQRPRVLPILLLQFVPKYLMSLFSNIVTFRPTVVWHFVLTYVTSFFPEVLTFCSLCDILSQSDPSFQCDHLSKPI
jgi:hypothetical protein